MLGHHNWHPFVPLFGGPGARNGLRVRDPDKLPQKGTTSDSGRPEGKRQRKLLSRHLGSVGALLRGFSSWKLFAGRCSSCIGSKNVLMQIYLPNVSELSSTGGA